MLESSMPVIDLFAGPGGLGEGFCAYGREEGQSRFRVCLSIEKDPWAYETLLLRHFFRMMPEDEEARKKYYDYIRTENLTVNRGHRKLFNLFPEIAARAESEVINAELGVEDPARIYEKISETIREKGKWVLIGGPPCQAYSVVGRSRNMGNPKYDADTDKRQQLYIEYLQILAEHHPAVFIMENVTGLLSATLNNQRIFEQMVDDLKFPYKALRKKHRKVEHRSDARYKLFSLTETKADGWESPRDFVIRMEDYGIPQMRHRLIIFGINTELGGISPGHLVKAKRVVDCSYGNGAVPARMVLKGLPEVRSGLSREPDDPGRWKKRIQEALKQEWFTSIEVKKGNKVHQLIKSAILDIKEHEFGRGGEFISCEDSFEAHRKHSCAVGA